MKTTYVNKYISGVESAQTHFSCLTAFSTIAWDDLEDCTSAVRRESDPLGSQVRRERKKTRQYQKEMISIFCNSRF